MRRLTVGLLALRAVATGALVLLLWNPVSSRLLPAASQPLVLLDASLSMAGANGAWRQALDTARAIVRASGGIIWRFGAEVAAFDSTPPGAGASRLRPALEAAAARGGPVVIVTDGEVPDVADAPPDLVRRARVIALPRRAFYDAFVAAVTGPRRVSVADSIRLQVSYGTAGQADRGGVRRKAALVVSAEGRQLARRDVALPDSGIVSTSLALPASRFPRPGWSAVEVRLEGVADAEPRDDARWCVVEVSPEPVAVILAAPPDWETRFLAATLRDVARLPLKVFVQADADGAAAWRDAVTLAPAPAADVQRALAAARLVVLAGDAARLGGVAPRGGRAVLTWLTGRGQEGDWYVERPPASPLAGALAGVAWDSLPPAAAATDVRPDSDAAVALTARQARRGPPRPILVLREREEGGARSATVAASGLWRWAFRGGAPAVAYRSLVAALADWLLAGGAGSRAQAVPVTLETPNGLPLEWRWAAAEPPRDLPITLAGAAGSARVDTLRFDAAGRATLRLPPGVYRYSVGGGGGRGVVAVELYSDEWRPAAPALGSQPGGAGGRSDQVGLRDRWWLFAIALAAFAAEWAWRRRQGLP